MRPATEKRVPSGTSPLSNFERASSHLLSGANLFLNGSMPFERSFASFSRRCSINEFSDGADADGCSINEPGELKHARAKTNHQISGHREPGSIATDKTLIRKIRISFIRGFLFWVETACGALI